MSVDAPPRAGSEPAGYEEHGVAWLEDWSLDFDEDLFGWIPDPSIDGHDLDGRGFSGLGSTVNSSGSAWQRIERLREVRRLRRQIEAVPGIAPSSSSPEECGRYV